jgi:predicted transcriptional regulator
MSNLSDDDATVSGAIIAHGPVSISTLNELLPDRQLAALSSAVGRLCELGLVERGMFPPKHGRSTILYSAVAK